MLGNDNGGLPRTGLAFPVWETAVVGGALIAGGAALRKYVAETAEETPAVEPPVRRDPDEW